MKEIGEIIETRARVEGISLTDEAVKSLADIGYKTSLRYAVQLLSPAGQLAKVSKQTQVDEKLVKEASQLFQDAGNSARTLKDRESEFLK
jgi:RuvB-like protein 1 (pontin 52)